MDMELPLKTPFFFSHLFTYAKRFLDQIPGSKGLAALGGRGQSPQPPIPSRPQTPIT